MFFPPRAYTFFATNAIRVLSIIALLLVFSSNILVLVNDIKAVRADGGDGNMVAVVNEKTGEEELYECDYIEGSTVPNQAAGAFWACLNRLFIIFTAILLLLSEIEWPEKFFINYIPVLGPEFGVGILGAIQWFLSASILSHHVDSFPLVSAFLLFSVGCLNILLGLIFRASVKPKRSITTFRETTPRELLPSSAQRVAPKDLKILDTSVGSIFSRTDDEKSYRAFNSRNDAGSGGSYGFGRQGEKQAALKGFLITQPVDSLPRYAPKPPSARNTSPRSSRAESPSPTERGRHVRTPSPPPEQPFRSSPRRI